jgi:glycerol-3-phosphate acyltransferase PlsY
MILKIALYWIAAYLLGSIPTAYLAGRILQGIDIRQHGSKNVGATNALRVLGRGAGISVLLIDILKGAAAVLLGLALGFSEEIRVLAGIFAICGHNWTIFLNFKGGKGVATSAGVFLALIPLSLLTALIVFIISVAITRYISVGSMLGAVVLGLTATLQYALDFGNPPQLLTLLLAWLASAFVIWRHRPNIQRLLQGNENRFSFGKGEKGQS